MKTEKLETKRALTIQEAAEYACVSRGTVENWLANRLIPYEKLPGRGNGSQRFVRIRKTDLDEFLNAQVQQPRQEKADTTHENIILLQKCSENRNDT